MSRSEEFRPHTDENTDAESLRFAIIAIENAILRKRKNFFRLNVLGDRARMQELDECTRMRVDD